MQKTLGEDVAYSGVRKNMAFLAEKGFLNETRLDQARKKTVFSLMIKGALASLFSPQVSNSSLLEQWRTKDWGPEYREVFKNVKDVSELRNFVEVLYMYGGSLEEVNEEILQRGVRNPEEASSLIRDASVTFENKVDKPGDHIAYIKYFPGTVACGLVDDTAHENNGEKAPPIVRFVVMPDVETNKKLFPLLQNPTFKTNLGVCLLSILQTIAEDMTKQGAEPVTSHYFSDSKSFILAATIPSKVVSLLDHPEQLIDPLKVSYTNLIRPFLEVEKFLTGEESYFTFNAFKYDPNNRKFSSLSKDEIKQKAHGVMEKIGSM